MTGKQVRKLLNNERAKEERAWNRYAEKHSTIKARMKAIIAQCPHERTEPSNFVGISTTGERRLVKCLDCGCEDCNPPESNHGLTTSI